MKTKADLFLATREDALRRGDRGVFKAMTAELHRLGHVEPAPLPGADGFPPLDAAALSRVNVMMETTEARAKPEDTAAPRPRRGRPPKAAV